MAMRARLIAAARTPGGHRTRIVKDAGNVRWAVLDSEGNTVAELGWTAAKTLCEDLNAAAKVDAILSELERRSPLFNRRLGCVSLRRPNPREVCMNKTGKFVVSSKDKPGWRYHFETAMASTLGELYAILDAKGAVFGQRLRRNGDPVPLILTFQSFTTCEEAQK